MDKSILAILGSPRRHGYSTFLANKTIESMEERNFKVDKILLRDLHIKPCIACNSCRKENSDYCIHNDDMKPLYEKIVTCDALLI